MIPEYINPEQLAESIDHHKDQHDDDTPIETVVVYELEAENPDYEDEEYWIISVETEKYAYTVYDHTSMAYDTGRVPLAGISPPRGTLHEDHINHVIRRVEPHQGENEFRKEDKIDALETEIKNNKLEQK